MSVKLKITEIFSLILHPENSWPYNIHQITMFPKSIHKKDIPYFSIQRKTTFIISLLVILLTQTLSAETKMPRIELLGTFGDDYTEGLLTLTDTTGKVNTLRIMAKWRGNSSKCFTKKCYAIKVIDSLGEKKNISLLNMRCSNSWILDAMASDMSRMRNRVSFDLWNDFSQSSYIKELHDSESFNGTHGQFVEVFLNGDYNGLYCFTEKLDRDQLKLKKVKDNGDIRGLLYKAENWYGTTFWDEPDSIDNKNETWMGYSSSYPDVDTDEDSTDWKPLYNALDFVLNANTQDFNDKVTTRFDLPVWMDYYLFINVTLACDNCGKNTFLYIYNKDNDDMLGLAPWDLDATWGRSWDISYLDETGILSNHFFDRLICESTDFMEKVADRYFELRKTYFSPASLKARFNNYYDYLKATGVLEREKARWDSIDNLTLHFDSEQIYIYNWIDKRITYLDNYFSGYATSGINRIVSSNKCSSDVFNLNGMKVNANTLEKGIYIRNRKKFIVP